MWLEEAGKSRVIYTTGDGGDSRRTRSLVAVVYGAKRHLTSLVLCAVVLGGRTSDQPEDPVLGGRSVGGKDI